MADVIRVRKGLDIPLPGAAAEEVVDVCDVNCCAVCPTDYVGFVPRLLVQEGDKVVAGTPLVCDKGDERLVLTAPVTGVVKTVVRGDRRQLQAVVVERMTASDCRESMAPLESLAELRQQLLQVGLWSCLIQRPFGTIAHPEAHPKAVFVSCCDSAPLAARCDVTLRSREKEFFRGLEVVMAVSAAPLHLSLRCNQRMAAEVESFVATHPQATLHWMEGPHPAGNVGTQIARIDPINKGEIVWTVDPQDVANIGRFVLTGRYAPERMVAVCGPAAQRPHYCRTVAGACVAPLLEGAIGVKERLPRVVSGNVLTGVQIATDGYLHARSNELTLIDEGDYYDFLGWLLPGLDKYSASRTFLSGLLPARWLQRCVGGRLRFDSQRHGDVRPLVFGEALERVFPFDIYPMELIKAAVVGDVERLERLGIYELEPEDMALCEFVDPSKTEIQTLIRTALEQCRKEAL